MTLSKLPQPPYLLTHQISVLPKCYSKKFLQITQNLMPCYSAMYLYDFLYVDEYCDHVLYKWKKNNGM